MEHARASIQRTLSQVKGFLTQGNPPRLSEANSEANFVEPDIAALGWEGIVATTPATRFPCPIVCDHPGCG